MNKELVAGEILLELKGLRERLTVLEQRLSEFVALETAAMDELQKEAEQTPTPTPSPAPTPAPAPAKPEPRKAPVDGRLISDLRRAIGLNDRFRFRNDLFRGDDQLMNETVEALDQMGTFAEAMAYVNERFDWSEDDETVRYLMDMLHRRYPD